jgi:hypothetical protein
VWRFLRSRSANPLCKASACKGRVDDDQTAGVSKDG